MSPRIQLGLPQSLRGAAAKLYWQAFGGKLGAVMGPDRLALGFLERAISPNHVITLIDETGALLGIAGFKTPGGSFAGGAPEDLVAAYGRIGAFWRSWMLERLSREIDNDRFLIDGIAVQSWMRGQGLGRMLVQALCDEASRRGYDYIRLDVIDSNWRAKALYERLGFVAVKSQPIGWLRFVFGFNASTVMVKPLV